MSGREITLNPTPSKLIFALRAIGYSLPQAIADLVDNSINAKANGVAVRVVTDAKSIRRILVVDDGQGMTEAELNESMRLGADSHRDVASLGKYGMGLKLASLSQAQRLTVLSRSKSHAGGRRWTIKGISEGWKCEVVDEAEVLNELDNPNDSLDLSKSGTIVVWEELDKIKQSKGGVEATVNLAFSHLKQHLGLHFHRFIEDGRLSIYLEKVNEKRPEDYRIERVSSLNPFLYEESGSDSYPKAFGLQLADGKSLEVEAHVWPANAASHNYKLGGKAAARQGFYFYRNDRLIQAGGWNETRGDAEPHLSLARVRVDLPKSLDEDFGLNVQKSSIQVGADFITGVSKAKANDGTVWGDYLKTANRTYRSGEKKNADNHPIVPEHGLNKSLRKELQQVLADGNGKTRKVSFEWRALAHSRVFDLDRDSHQILLNSQYRRILLQGQRAGTGDAVLLKVLLFMLNRELLFTERYSSQQREQVETVNKVLWAAMATLDED